MGTFLSQKKIYEFSVSDILLLDRCKKALAFKLDGKKVKFNYEKYSYTGMLLHKVLKKFSDCFNQNLFNDYKDKTFSEIHKSIDKQLYQLLLSEIDKDKNSSLDIVSNYLEYFGVYFAQVVEKNKNNLQDIFVFSEKPFRFYLTDRVIIKGRLDVVINDRGLLKIIDYKTGKENFEKDSFQIALYYKGMKENFNIETHPMLIYFEEKGIRQETYSPEEIETIINVVEKLTNSFIEEYESHKVPKTTRSEECNFCSMRGYPSCRFS